MSVRWTVLLFLLGSVLEKSEQSRKCFGPVYCVDEEGQGQPTWRQVYSSVEEQHCLESSKKQKGERGDNEDDTKVWQKGDRGPPGLKGETGDPGPKGSTMTDESALRKIVEDMFPQYYNGKTFLAIVSDKATLYSALRKCQHIGGDLIDINDQVHMDKIMTFIRKNKMDREVNKNFWTGMNYDPEKGKLYFRNGTRILQSLRWKEGFPRRDGGAAPFKSVFLTVSLNASNTEQYLYNFPDTPEYVLCEV